MKAPSRVAVALGEGVGTNLKIVLDPLHTFHLPRQFGRAGLALGPWNRTRQRNRSPFGGDQEARSLTWPAICPSLVSPLIRSTVNRP